MKQIMALAWKEWRALRGFFWPGIVFFVGIQLFFFEVRPFDDPPSPDDGGDLFLTMFFGSLFGLIAAIGGACGDLGRPGESFWRSCAISLRKAMAVKYLSGLSMVLAVLALTHFVGYVLPGLRNQKPGDDRWALAFSHTFTIMLAYSSAFFIGCVFHKRGQAAILSVVAVVFIYCLPLVVPPLEILNCFYWMEELQKYLRPDLGLPARLSEYFGFVLAMLTLSSLLAYGGLLALRGNWRVQFSQKTLIWSLAFLLLGLFSTAAFQVASNIKSERKIRLPLHMYPTSLVMKETRGILTFYSAMEQEKPLRIQPIDMAVPGILAGKQTSVGPHSEEPWLMTERSLVWQPENRERLYCLTYKIKQVQRQDRDWNSLLSEMEVHTVSLEKPANDNVICRNDLFPLLSEEKKPVLMSRDYNADAASICGIGNNLHINAFSGKIITLSLDNPDSPTLVSVTQGPGLAVFPEEAAGEKGLYKLDLLPLPGATPRERLDAWPKLIKRWSNYAVEGDTIVGVSSKGLTVYRLAKLENDSAYLRKMGYRAFTPMEALSDWAGQQIIFSKGLVYYLQRSLFVFDVRDPMHPRRVGHFRSPDAKLRESMALLPDGRILLAGKELYLLKAPRAE